MTHEFGQAKLYTRCGTILTPQQNLCCMSHEEHCRYPQQHHQTALYIDISKQIFTFGIPVQVCDVTWASFAHTSSFTPPHAVDIHEIIVRTHCQKLPVCQCKIWYEIFQVSMKPLTFYNLYYECCSLIGYVLAFNHECRSPIGYATRYVDSRRQWVA